MKWIVYRVVSLLLMLAPLIILARESNGQENSEVLFNEAKVYTDQIDLLCEKISPEKWTWQDADQNLVDITLFAKDAIPLKLEAVFFLCGSEASKKFYFKKKQLYCLIVEEKKFARKKDGAIDPTLGYSGNIKSQIYILLDGKLCAKRVDEVVLDNSTINTFFEKEEQKSKEEVLSILKSRPTSRANK